MQIQLEGNKIWIFCKSLDFRKSIDGLSSFIVNDMKQNVQENIYLFYNKDKDKIKCLSWHKNGFIMIYKRLERGKFCFKFNNKQGVMEMNVVEVGWLLAGLEWQKMREWRDLPYDTFS